MSDAAGFERTMWLGKEPVLIALVAASAGFASLSASDLIASADGPGQLGSLQSAIPVPAFGGVPTKVRAPASEEAAQAPIAPIARAARIEAAPAEPAPAMTLPVPAVHVATAPVLVVPTALAAPVVAAPELPLPAPARESVDVAFAEFRTPAMPVAELAPPDPAPPPQPAAQLIAQPEPPPTPPAPKLALAEPPVAAEIAAVDAPISEASLASAEVPPHPAAEDFASAPPVFDGPPLIFASLKAGGPALPAQMQPLPELAPLDTGPVALAAAAEEGLAPPAAPSPEAQAEVLAASEPAAPAPSLAARPETLDAAALDAAALAEWTRSVRQVGGWSLAQAADAPAALASSPVRQAGNVQSPAFRDAPPAARKHRLTGRGIEFALPVVIEGRDPAWVPLLIDAEQNVSVRIGDLLALIEPMLPAETFTRLSGSKGAQEFVSLRSLRLQGIDFRYDAPRNRLVLGEIASASGAPRMALRNQ